MTDNSDRSAWCAIRVHSRNEQSVAKLVNERGYEEFAPTYRTKRKWYCRVKVIDLPLFLGYVFSRFDSAEMWQIISLPGVIGIVHFGTVLAPIDDGEIEALWRVIVHGPLAGLTGAVIQVRDELRLVLSVNLLQRSVLVHVRPDDIRLSEANENRRSAHVATASPSELNVTQQRERLTARVDYVQ